MAFIGNQPTAVPLTGSDLADDIITLAKMSTGTDGNIISYDASGNPVAIATGSDGQVLTSAGAGAPPAFAASGKVLQVVSTTVTAQNSSTNTDEDTYSGIGLEVAITPVSSSSRFYITCDVGIGTTGGNTWGLILFRGSSKVGNGAASGSRKGIWFRGVDNAGNGGADASHGIGGSGSYFDTTTGTAGSAITFKAGGITESGTMYINRTGNFDDTAAVHGVTTSTTITVMEVEA